MNDQRRRCEQLLADQATHDLSEAERQELECILLQHPEWRDETFELAAAALHLLSRYGWGGVHVRAFRHGSRRVHHHHAGSRIGEEAVWAQRYSRG